MIFSAAYILIRDLHQTTYRRNKAQYLSTVRQTW